MEELKNTKAGKRPPPAHDTKSKTNKTRAPSRGSGGSNKTNKTNKTSKSRKSSKSGISRSKYQRLKSLGMQQSSAQHSQSSSYQAKLSDIDRGSTENNNPHNRVIGKKFLSNFKKSRVYIESIKFSEFKEIAFKPDGYPKFAIDLLKYITLVDLGEQYRLKRLEQKR